jgi:hypothetical protein
MVLSGGRRTTVHNLTVSDLAPPRNLDAGDAVLLGTRPAAAHTESQMDAKPNGWPDGKDFVFTVFDDTDNATASNVGPVYDLLSDLGLRTTKSVWPVAGVGTPHIGGATCDDPGYRAWTLALQARGFEIGYHGATNTTAPRELIVAAIERFRDIYGHYPMSMANHSGCADSIYWGPDRVSGIHRLAYNLMTRNSRNGVFRGHVEGDSLFWGDICRAKVRYVRNFTYPDINTLAACPVMPYHDPARPYVNRWFASTEGQKVDGFNACLSEANQDRLEAEGGVCIMYTHFASGFVIDGVVNARFRQLMERLARRNGWFVPVTPVLDFLSARQTDPAITAGERRRLERQWLLGKARVGYS